MTTQTTALNEYLPEGVRMQDIDGWEDNYGATKFATFEAFIADLESYTFSDWLGRLNQPIWIHYDAENGGEWDCGAIINVGILQPRHGRCWIKMAPCTKEEAQRVCDLLGRFWAGRMDIGFDRYK